MLAQYLDLTLEMARYENHSWWGEIPPGLEPPELRGLNLNRIGLTVHA